MRAAPAAAAPGSGRARPRRPAPWPAAPFRLAALSAGERSRTRRSGRPQVAGAPDRLPRRETLSPPPRPGSCTYSVGYGKVRGAMLLTIAIVLLVLWGLGLVTSYTMGGLVHLLLVLAIIAVLVSVIQGRRLTG
jgi:hypothetical protein